jgi:cytochrome b561
MASVQNPVRYDNISIRFHWLTAVLITLLWLMAQSEAVLPREWRHAMWSVHIALGGLLIVVYASRLLWRLTKGSRPASVNSGILRAIEHAVHALLYALVATTLILGLANVCARGWDLFGLVQIPALAADDRALRRSINGWHELAANCLVALALAHAGAALFHHFIFKDGALSRMSPWR